MLVVAADQNHGDAVRAAAGQQLPHQPLALGRGRRLVKGVAADQERIDPLPPRDVEDLLERLGVFLMARAALEQLADMPIAGVQEPHQARKSANGSSPARDGALASVGRVAHAGKGNWTISGTGISGWCTMRLPGFKMPARSRVTAGRKPYSPRSASAMSRRPTMR